jgi:hypothetical protein
MIIPGQDESVSVVLSMQPCRQNEKVGAHCVECGMQILLRQTKPFEPVNEVIGSERKPRWRFQSSVGIQAKNSQASQPWPIFWKRHCWARAFSGGCILATMAYVEGGAHTVVAALLEVLGTRGTLVAPSFTFAHKGEEDFIINLQRDPEKTSRSRTFDA